MNFIWAASKSAIFSVVELSIVLLISSEKVTMSASIDLCKGIKLPLNARGEHDLQLAAGSQGSFVSSVPNAASPGPLKKAKNSNRKAESKFCSHPVKVVTFSGLSCLWLPSGVSKLLIGNIIVNFCLVPL